MKTPEIRIYFSWLLYERVSVHLNELWNKDSKRGAFATPEACDTYAESYRQEWAKYNDSILPALCESVGLEFYKPVIDVPCAPWIGSISDPLTLNFRNSPDQFVDALTHELCHVLLTDNTVFSWHSSPARVRLEERWSKLYGAEHSFTALIHIPVHALCKYMYLDVLKEPARLKRDITAIQDSQAYTTAWRYVEAHDYRQIIEQLGSDYQALAQELART